MSFLPSTENPDHALNEGDRRWVRRNRRINVFLTLGALGLWGGTFFEPWPVSPWRMGFDLGGLMAALALIWSGMPRRSADAAMFASRAFRFWAVLWCALFLPLLALLAIGDDPAVPGAVKTLLVFGVLGRWACRRFNRGMRTLLPRAALAFITIVVVLLGFEGAIAVFPILDDKVEAYRREQLLISLHLLDLDPMDTILIEDPILGAKYRPNLTGFWQSDQWGFPNDNLDLSRPYDVVVVGDSFVAEIWPSYLRNRTGWRIANLGVGGYSPPQYTEVVRRYALLLKPKFILYCLYANDAIESYSFQHWRQSGLSWFAFRGETRHNLSAAETWKLRAHCQIVRWSSIYILIQYSRHVLDENSMAEVVRPLRYSTDRIEIGFRREILTKDSNLASEVVQQGLEVIRNSLGEAAELCSEADVELIFLLMPPKELVYYEALEKVKGPDDPIDNLPAFYRKLEAMCEELGVETHDLTERFRAEATVAEEVLYLDGDIHWNQAGSRVMAKVAAEILSGRGIGTPSSTTDEIP